MIFSIRWLPCLLLPPANRHIYHIYFSHIKVICRVLLRICITDNGTCGSGSFCWAGRIWQRSVFDFEPQWAEITNQNSTHRRNYQYREHDNGLHYGCIMVCLLQPLIVRILSLSAFSKVNALEYFLSHYVQDFWEIVTTSSLRYAAAKPPSTDCTVALGILKEKSKREFAWWIC